MNEGAANHLRSAILYMLLILFSSLAILSLISLVIAALDLTASDPKTLFWDFRNAYYPAGADVLLGKSLSPLIHKGVLGFVNLPILAWLFAPFALLPAKIAALAFTLIGIAALGLGFWLMADLAGLKGQARGWLLLAMAANGPLIYSLKLGNTSHIVLAMLAGGLWLLRRNRAFLAGLLLGLAALIKLPLLLFGFYFVFRRNFRAALGFFTLVLFLAVFSLTEFGRPFHLQWYKDAIGMFNGHALAAFNVQSLQSFLLRLREPAPALADWRLYALDPQTRLTALFTVLVFFGLFAWTCGRLDRKITVEVSLKKQDRDYMALVVLCLISSPLSWTHYYCWLLLPTAFAIKAITEKSRLPWILILAVLLVSPPVTLISISLPAFAAVYEKVLVSTYLFGGIIWFISLTLFKTCDVTIASEPELALLHE
jgi:alpha-1,2-mannosyltransferase